MSRTSRGKIANEFVDENNQVDDNNNYYYADNNDVAVIIDEAYVIMWESVLLFAQITINCNLWTEQIKKHSRMCNILCSLKSQHVTK